jgi:hypothetical protein
MAGVTTPRCSNWVLLGIASPCSPVSTLGRRLVRHHGDRLVVDSGDDLILEWEQRGLAWRRRVLDTVVDRLEVAPSAIGVGRRVANRTAIRWRAQQGRDPASDDVIFEGRRKALTSA